MVNSTPRLTSQVCLEGAAAWKRGILAKGLEVGAGGGSRTGESPVHACDLT